MTMRNCYAMVPTTDLVGADYNPNTMSKAAFDALVTEVRKTGGLMKPVVVRMSEGRHTIVDGHFNWAAARVAGLPAVPIEIIEADEFEARRQTLIRNRTGRKDKAWELIQRMEADPRKEKPFPKPFYDLKNMLIREKVFMNKPAAKKPGG